MKTIQELKQQEPVYLNNWRNMKDLIQDFTEYYGGNDPQVFENINILFASYGTDNYTGDAFVLFEQDDKLYEVNGSHCSCYGLEGQFEPEETALEALKLRLEKGRLGYDSYSGNVFADNLKEFIGL